MLVLNYNRYKFFFFSIFFVLFFVSHLKSQEQEYLNSVIDRINDLELDLKNIQKTKKYNKKDSESGVYINAIASHEQRLLELEEEIRVLNGSLEELNFKIEEVLKKINFSYQKQNKEFSNNSNPENLTQDTDIASENSIIIEDPNIKKNPSMKILGTINENKDDKIEDDKNSYNFKQAEQSKEKINSKSTTEEELKLLSKKPSEIYSYAYDMLVRENFIEAEKSFKAFIGEHPTDPLASNAYYWLGETYYVQKKFQLAAISFARGFQSFPKGNKAIDQLFKLALTFMNLGKNEDACAAFSKLESEFPDAPKRISNRAKEYIKRAKC
tara:strand:- start:1889 stop:2866 length:978 start_codon:yes stop_codon:yes gene_type:complete